MLQLLNEATLHRINSIISACCVRVCGNTDCNCVFLFLSPSQRHEFEVAMTCEGCSGAVSRILNKLGVETFEIDLPKKLVWIESDKDVQVLTEALKKSGKEVKYVGTK
ncbi:hypothetical protein fugu_013150 [Takifugu bimaculatus]|uniref:Copper transport protein ATOX1 n=2 Tax=Takifugu TaxID=31032 RepID=A0A5C6MLI0_9TELE|nr:hypothetical protein fugu_013150 [Takifugu bimaculatus]TWW55458.1 Copper transport protein ATOX1 [Takifugu flavidus]